MATEPPPHTYWTQGQHLDQILMIEGHPAAIVYPTLNRAEILPAKHRSAQTIAAPWSVSPFDLVEQHFDFERVRVMPNVPGRRPARPGQGGKRELPLLRQP